MRGHVCQVVLLVAIVLAGSRHSQIPLLLGKERSSWYRGRRRTASARKGIVTALASGGRLGSCQGACEQRPSPLRAPGWRHSLPLVGALAGRSFRPGGACPVNKTRLAPQQHPAKVPFRILA